MLDSTYADTDISPAAAAVTVFLLIRTMLLLVYVYMLKEIMQSIKFY